MVYYYIVNVSRKEPVQKDFTMALSATKAAEWMIIMDVQVEDTLVMKKPHPCGSHEFFVLRSGADFRLRCLGCGHEMMIPRVKIEHNIKHIVRACPKTE